MSQYLHVVAMLKRRDKHIARLKTQLSNREMCLHEIAEEWAGAECGEPVHAQEAYAIGLARRMYALAVEGLTPNVELSRQGGAR